MVTRISGLPRQGLWFSSDIATVRIETTGGDFINDVNGVNPPQSNALEDILQILAQYGTIIGMSIESATVVHVMVDYAQPLISDDTIETALVSAIDNIDLSSESPSGPNLSNTDITIFDGFRGGNNA